MKRLVALFWILTILSVSIFAQNSNESEVQNNQANEATNFLRDLPYNLKLHTTTANDLKGLGVFFQEIKYGQTFYTTLAECNTSYDYGIKCTLKEEVLDQIIMTCSLPISWEENGIKIDMHKSDFEAILNKHHINYISNSASLSFTIVNNESSFYFNSNDKLERVEVMYVKTKEELLFDKHIAAMVEYEVMKQEMAQNMQELDEQFSALNDDWSINNNNTNTSLSSETSPSSNKIVGFLSNLSEELEGKELKRGRYTDNAGASMIVGLGTIRVKKSNTDFIDGTYKIENGRLIINMFFSSGNQSFVGEIIDDKTVRFNHKTWKFASTY